MRILLVEDNADHTELMRLVLTGHDPTWQVDGVVSGEETLRHLAEGKTYDLVFLDYGLPGQDGLDVLAEIRRGEAPPPVVMVTGRGNERVATEALKGGAYDYVVKEEGYLERLPVVAQRAVEAYQLAVERRRADEVLRSSGKRYRDLVDNSLIGIYRSSLDGTILFANNSLMRMLEYSSLEDIASDKVFSFHRDARDCGLFINLLKAGAKLLPFTTEMVPKTGAVKTVLLSAALDRELLSGMVLDITERKNTEAALMSAKDRLEQLSQRLLEFQKSERRMLARELHDEIGQMLTAAKTGLEVIRRSPLQGNLAARLDSSVATLHQCLRHARNLSLSLRPPMLDDLGLVTALATVSAESQE
jgi:PAS domain S-box-containing protein